MRKGVRDQLLKQVPDLKEVYEPGVPKHNTPKPYAVVVQKSDDERQDPTNFSRNLDVWIYTDIESFTVMDKLTDQVREALNLKRFEDPQTKEKYTSSFKGVLGQDLTDEEWGANVRGLSFNVIALHYPKATDDEWAGAISDMLTKELDIPAYISNWDAGFSVPSILCRTVSQEVEDYNYFLYYDRRQVRVHIVSDNREEKEKIVRKVNHLIVSAIKIPISKEDKIYMTVDNINTNINADMLGVGQVTINLYRIQNIHREAAETIKHSGRHKQR